MTVSSEHCVTLLPVTMTAQLLVLLLLLVLPPRTRAADQCSIWSSFQAVAAPSTACSICDDVSVTDTKDLQFYLKGNHTTLSAEHLPRRVCKLWANHRAIGNISRDAFAHLRCLRRALLGFNALVQLDPFTFANNSDLLQLMLNNNSLRLPANGPFLVSASLQILNLSSCGIAEVYNASFRELPNLSALLLRANKLRTLNRAVFASLRRLEVLDVSENAIARIDFVSKLGMRCLYAVKNPLENLLPTLMKFQLNITLVFSKEVCCCSWDHCNHSASHWISKCEQCYDKYTSFSTSTTTPAPKSKESSTNAYPLSPTNKILSLAGPIEATIPRYNMVQTSVVIGPEKKQTQSANLAVILLSTIFSFLILLQSAFIVFLLIKVKRRETPNVYLEVTNGSIINPPLIYCAKEQVTDLDAESCSHVSLNPVYETIPE